MTDKTKQQNKRSISSTARNLLRGYILRKIFSYLMDNVFGLGELPEQLIDWLREVFEEDQF